ncbi:MAG: hypothetical protein QF473_15570 [Planctomycetota bacterium]|nr:hypothetical protein [Planctomycetota bacterium]
MVDAVIGAARIARILVRPGHHPRAAVERGHVLGAEVPDRRQRHADIGEGLGDRAAVLPRMLVARVVRGQIVRPVGMPAAPLQLLLGDRLPCRPRRFVDLGLHDAYVRVECGPGHPQHARLRQVLGKDLAGRQRRPHRFRAPVLKPFGAVVDLSGIPLTLQLYALAALRLAVLLQQLDIAIMVQISDTGPSISASPPFGMPVPME